MRRATAVAALCLTLLATGQAQGAESAPPRAQAIADATADWISAQLRAPVAHRPVLVLEDSSLPVWAGGQVGAFGASIEVRDTTAIVWSYMGPASPQPQFGALLIHELLHDGDQAHDLFIEEGVVEAVAADLYPAWSARFFGHAWWVGARGYRPNVAAVRAASRYATGARSWREREPRLWRRRLLLADEPERLAMLTAAEQRRCLA